MPNKAGFVTLTITSGEAFTVLNNTDWIKTTLNGSNLSIYINENNANLNRNGTLTIAGCVNRNISIVQNGKLGQCTQELIPASGNWILRNEYSNQNGSTFSTENNAMKLTYPQWAQDNYYLIQTKSTKLETGKKYSVSVDIQGTNVSSISDIKVGFASGETWNGPTGYLVPLQSVGGQISNSSFTSKSIELITTIAGTGYLTMYITLNNQPSQSASYYFKNINICEKDILEAVGQNVISNNIDESKSLPVFAYPNPVQNRLHFPFSNYFQLSDLYGKVIFRGQDSSELNTDLLAPGLYVFNFTSNGKETQQLIIKK